MRVKVSQMKFYLKVKCIDPYIRRQRMKRSPRGRNRTRVWIGRTVAVVSTLPHRIDVQLDQVFEQPAKRFKNAAVEVFVIFFVKYFQQIINTHCDTDHLFCVPAEVGCESVELEII